MAKQYKITAGDNSTDLGIVGHANTLLGAKRIGRKAVRESLPCGEGRYRVWDQDGWQVLGGERSIRTYRVWNEIAVRWKGLKSLGPGAESLRGLFVGRDHGFVAGVNQND